MKIIPMRDLKNTVFSGKYIKVHTRLFGKFEHLYVKLSLQRRETDECFMAIFFNV